MGLEINFRTRDGREENMERERLIIKDFIFPYASSSMSWEVVRKHEGAVISPMLSIPLF